MSLIIDLARGELRSAPRKDRPNRREMWYPVTCPECQHQYWLRKPDAERRSRCDLCGKRKARLNSRAWSEIMVRDWLDDAGIPYVEEAIYRTVKRDFLIDFVIGDLAVEINGWGHKLFHRAQRDQELETVWRGDVLFIPTTDLKERPDYVRNCLLGALVLEAS